MSVTGSGKVNRRLMDLRKNLARDTAAANATSGRAMVRLARALIPVVSGDSQDEIEATQFRDGSVLVDFGQKARVIEADRGPRPFVGPTKKRELKKHKDRVRRAISKAVRRSFNGG
jgi:hypothetical protein